MRWILGVKIVILGSISLKQMSKDINKSLLKANRKNREKIWVFFCD